MFLRKAILGVGACVKDLQTRGLRVWAVSVDDGVRTVGSVRLTGFGGAP